MSRSERRAALEAAILQAAQVDLEVRVREAQAAALTGDELAAVRAWGRAARAQRFRALMGGAA